MALNPNIGWHPPTRTRQPATGPQAQYRWPSEVRILNDGHLTVNPAKKKRTGIDPFTKQERVFAAKPATVKIKTRALKKLKDAAL